MSYLYNQKVIRCLKVGLNAESSDNLNVLILGAGFPPPALMTTTSMYCSLYASSYSEHIACIELIYSSQSPHEMGSHRHTAKEGQSRVQGQG